MIDGKGSGEAVDNIMFSVTLFSTTGLVVGHQWCGISMKGGTNLYRLASGTLVAIRYDLDPTEHLWDFVFQFILRHQVAPQTVQELSNAPGGHPPGQQLSH